jgi:protein Tex
MNFSQVIAQELSVKAFQVQAALDLIAEGATVPFIARYRKERTGELDEVQLRQIADRFSYLTELCDRKSTVLESIESQGKLTADLRAKIEACQSKTELEDLYLPYRPKRRTRATIAKEKGLEPLAIEIAALNQSGKAVASLDPLAQPYVSAEKGVATVQEALQGAADILAEGVAEQAELRSHLRHHFLTKGVFSTKMKGEYPEGSTKYEMYRNYQIAAPKIAPHNLLAVLRGEKEDILKVALEIEEADVLAYLESTQIRSRDKVIRGFYQSVVKDAFNRLMKTSLTTEVIAEKKAEADAASIETFEANLKNLLLSAPAGMKPTLGVDPGFRTGCKVAAISETGKFLEYQAIFPHTGDAKRQDAAKVLKHLIVKHKIELIAIGNGTASRETDAFVADILKTLDKPPIKVTVNESGASIYSASDVAIAEFPDLDLTIRGAISIARRLQDPLAELVKIDAKSIGVGQYQHDVDQKRLKQKLDETVESCVNYVGVDLNMASRELLTYVSGITSAIANNIVAYRNEKGAFCDRNELLKVTKLGPKAFEQAAGFLRIRNGKNPLDNTAVHPERYKLVQAMSTDLQLDLGAIAKSPERLKSLDLKRYVSDAVGLPTLRDILTELEKPGRDPRAQFTYASFKDNITEISDLTVGMELEGVITNVANFGAFVDIGVHQDGLVHVSQMADKFVKDPKEIVQVGQIVKVKVLEVNVGLKRISLTMKAEPVIPSKEPGASRVEPASRHSGAKPVKAAKADPKPAAPPTSENQSTHKATLADLQAKFNRGKR